MIKFVESHVFQIQEFVDENGTRYRTTNGNYWEELMGESWESVYRDEELTTAYNKFQREADKVKDMTTVVEFIQNYDTMYGSLRLKRHSKGWYVEERIFAAVEVEWNTLFGPFDDEQIKQLDLRKW